MQESEGHSAVKSAPKASRWAYGPAVLAVCAALVVVLTVARGPGQEGLRHPRAEMHVAHGDGGGGTRLFRTKPFSVEHAGGLTVTWCHLSSGQDAETYEYSVSRNDHVVDEGVFVYKGEELVVYSQGDDRVVARPE